MNREKAFGILCALRQEWKSLFFFLTIVFALGSMFCISPYYVDRFFTSGMLWIGYVVIVGWMVWLLGNKEMIKLPWMMVYLGGILLVYGARAWWNGYFFVQEFVFWVVLCGLMWLLAQENKGIDEICICICVASVGIVEALWGIGQWIGWITKYNLLFPVTGSFDNPAGYAIVLVVCLPFVFHALCRLKSSWRVYMWCVLAVMSGGILLSGSRTGIVGMGVVIVVCVLHYVSWNRKIRKWIIRGGVVVGIVLLAGLYFIRRDSADGRLLVWCCTWKLISEKPMLGYGVGSFEGRYMPVQARYLSDYQNERYEWLAGNIKHPFNEYLKLWVEYGAVGIVVLAIGVVGVLRCKREEEEICFVARMSMMAIGVCGLFSYPLNYPSVCCLLSLNGGVLLRYEKGCRVGVVWMRVIGLLVCVVLFAFICYWQRMERCWYQTSQLALSETMEVLPIYRKLYDFMGRNPLFLYNYGAELHARGLWNEAAMQLEICANYLNDTDVQLLLAESYMHIGDERKAESCLVLASQMCPNLFVPEYQLVKLYRLQGRENEALAMAKRLLEKPVKIQSYVVRKIRKEMQEYLNKVSDSDTVMEK